MRIAILWSRFGPYHFARLRAAQELFGSDVQGIEVASKDQYAWSTALRPSVHGVRTLFPDRIYSDLSDRQIKSAICSLLDEFSPNVVAINGWATAESRAALRWVRARCGIAVVMSETQESDGRRFWPKERFKSFVIRGFDAALVGGTRQRQYLLGLGFPTDRIFAGYDCVDNEHFNALSDLARRERVARVAALGLPERYFFVCTRFLPRKNVQRLLIAYRDYRDRGGQWGLVVAGSGVDEESLKALALEHALDDVRWPGFLNYDELPTYYGLASAFVHPAEREAWGLVVNEAAASGLPLLVSRAVGSAPELVREGENGFLFDPFSEAEMADAMLKISRLDEGVLSEMGEGSRSIVAQFGPDRFATGLAEAVRSTGRDGLVAG